MASGVAGEDAPDVFTEAPDHPSYRDAQNWKRVRPCPSCGMTWLHKEGCTDDH